MPEARPSSPAVVTPRPFLDDDILAATTRGAVLARIGRSGIAPETMQPPGFLKEAGHLDIEMPVVEERADLVRVVHEEYGVRYGLYIESEDLAERPEKYVNLSRSPSRDTQMDVELAGGAPVDIVGRRDGWTHITLAQEGLAVDGWLPDDALARVFTRQDFDLAERAEVLRLVASTWILDQPAGRRIAELRTEEYPMRAIHRVGPSRARHAEVEATIARARVRGFVPEDAIAARQPKGYGGGGSGSGWGASHTSWLEVPLETLIHVTPDGPVFAMTVEDRATIALTRERQGAWVAVRFRTLWRMIPGWVECPGLRRVKDALSRFECTAPDDPERIEELPQW